jgi:hypothetical protein
VPYCPSCKTEYVEGVKVCPDCGTFLVDELPSEDNPLLNADTVSIYKVADENEAYIIKGLLESEGILSLLQTNVDQTVFPFTVDGLGEVSILVLENDAERGRKIIEEAKRERGEILEEEIREDKLEEGEGE